MKKILFSLLSIVLIPACFAQKTKQSDFTEKGYIIEIESLYKKEKNLSKEVLKQFENLLKQYESFWNTIPFNTKEKLAEISTRLLKIRASTYPDFYNFLNTQLELNKKFPSAPVIHEWVLCSEVVLNEKRKLSEFNDFLNFSLQLVNRNILYESRSSVWDFANGTSYSFKASSKDIAILFTTPFDMNYNSQTDGGTIYKTTGTYYPLDNKWIGSGGKIDWSRTGISEEKCYAQLNRIEVNVKQPKFTADSVLFTYTDYFQTPMLGKIEEQLTSRMDAEKYTFPRFRSFTKEFVIKNLFPDVDYQGSFMMNGAKFLTSGVEGITSTIIFYRHQKPFLLVESPNFIIDNEKLSSKSASVILLIDDDSITNTGVEVNFRKTSKEVTIVNSYNRNFNSPYENTYHNLDMFCENMVWKIEEDKIYISNSGQLNTLTSIQLESSNYFSENRFKTIQGIEAISPLHRVYKFCELKKDREFYINEFARYINMDIMQAKTMIHNLAKYGLTAYDPNEERVFVKQKLFNYAKSFTKSMDYDVITISSEVASGPNAILDLSNYDLQVNGVRKLSVSDTQNVLMQPENGNLIVQKNRNLVFSGQITVGWFTLFIKDCFFNYDEFNISLPHVDSLSFYTTSFTDKDVLMMVKTKLNDLKGEIAIDMPNNKAGLKKRKDYPIFKSMDNSYAYYESPIIKNGVYLRDRFYYKLDPFTIRNMMKFQPDSISFTGTFYSAGIFPEMKEPLKIQKDYSLGFITKTGNAGLPAYGGKGTYYEVIDLSNKGLLGRGKINYLSSESVSKDIVFMPDSAHIVTDTFFVVEKPDFAEAKAGKTIERWYPYNDQFYVYSKDTPLRLYKNEVSLYGNLLLEPKGLTGSGKSTIHDIELSSKEYAFKQNDILSESTECKLYNPNKDMVFYAGDIRANIHIKNRIGEFSAAEPARTLLPLMQYAAYVDKFTWQMDKHELAFSNSKAESDASIQGMDIRALAETDMPGSLFVSTHPQQDSLHFYAMQGIFKYRENLLKADKVYSIQVADVLIAPDKNQLTIEMNAQIQPIPSCKILADLTGRFHVFYDANVQIHSRNDYEATGSIDYLDENKKKYKILLTKIAPKNKITEAIGIVKESEGFMLSPAFGFAGNVTIIADEEHYSFSGGAQLQHVCKATQEVLPFTRFSAKIDPESILIPIAEVPSDINNERVTASILFNKTNLSPYTAFLTKDKAIDNELLGAYGFLTYNKANKAYQIGSTEKLEDPENASGSFLQMEKDNCNVMGEGRINFGIDQEFVNYIAYGSIETNNTKSETKLNTIFGFSFPFVQQAIDIMGQYIFDDLGLSPMDLNDENLRKALCEYLGSDKGNMLFNSFIGYGEFEKVPKEFNHSLFFNNIKLTYSPDLGYHFNGMAGLGMVGKYQINKLVKTKMQLYKYRSSVLLKIYLEITPEQWYYFNYDCTNRRMRVLSSIEEYDQLIRNLSADARTKKGKSGKSYTFGLGVSQSEAINFKRLMDGVKGVVVDEDIDEEEDEEVIEDDTDTTTKEEVEE